VTMIIIIIIINGIFLISSLLSYHLI
jgi:hypothetical protein